MYSVIAMMLLHFWLLIERFALHGLQYAINSSVIA